MNSSTLTIHWHEQNMPVYSVAFQPQTGSKLIANRLVTGGGDNNIRIWGVKHNHIPSSQLNDLQSLPSQQTTIEYLSTLRKHTQAVNVVRFNNQGNLLASAADDGTLMIWRLADKVTKSFEEQGDGDDDDDVESWEVVLQLRSSMSEINDICWSPNDQYIIAGSMDNTVRIYHLDYSNGSKITGKLYISFNNHSHYVQGVTWDPSNQFIATQSSDRSVIIYKIIHDSNSSNHKEKIKSIKYLTKLTKFRNNFMYYPETLQSFFRRLTFSPDGSLLIAPCGIDEATSTNHATDSSTSASTTSTTTSTSSGSTANNNSDKNNNDDGAKNSVYVYSRKSLPTSPIFKITGLNKPATVISFNPNLYQLPPSPLTSTPHKLNLPYQMIFAVATQESIVIYNTSDFHPLGYVSNLHYSYITDIAWSPEGDKIIVSSTDGFCSIVSFDEGIFGPIYSAPPVEKVVDEAVEAIPHEEVNELMVDHSPKQEEIITTDSLAIADEKPVEVLVNKDEDNDIVMIDEDDQQANKENINQEAQPTITKTPTKTIDHFFTKVNDSSSSPKKDKSKRRVVPTLITS